MIQQKQQTGFTLLEILLVVTAIVILASIVILAINPTRQIGKTQNAQRAADINAILNGISQYAIDNSGTLPASLTVTSTEMCKTGTLPATCTTNSLIDLSVITASETYLTSLPIDPLGSIHVSGNGNGYKVNKTANNRITVSAPQAVLGVTLTITR